MAVLYKMYKSTAQNKTLNKWYARATMVGVSNLDALAERIQRNCTAKKSDVLAVLSELVEVMQDELQASRKVRLDGFGSFKVGLCTVGANNLEDWSAQKNIRRLHIVFTPEAKKDAAGKMRKQFLSGARVQEAPDYTQPVVTPAGNTPTLDPNASTGAQGV